MAAEEHLQRSLFKGLAGAAEGMHPEDRSFVQGALRAAGTGYTGPVDAFDADQIDRSRDMLAALKSSGLGVDFGDGAHSRGGGFRLPSGHQVTITPQRNGVHVNIDNEDYTKRHEAVLPVQSMAELPDALMRHLTTPEVRFRAGL